MCCVVLGVSVWALGQDESLWTLVDLSHVESSASSVKSARTAAILLIVSAVFVLGAVVFGSYAAAKVCNTI